MTELVDDAWSGERAFIVGGGPSLRGFAWDRLLGERVIAINRALEVLPWAELAFGMDKRFWKRPATRELVEARGDRLNVYPLYGEVWDPYEGISTVRGRAGRFWGRSFEEGIGIASHSGYGALNLADLLGAEPIYLLGFDYLNGGGRQNWWHDGYDWKPQPANVYDRFVDDMAHAARVVRRLVVNLNPRSGLRSFTRGTLEGIGL